jgi:hypothetical protein
MAVKDTTKESKLAVAKEKKKPIGYVNWEINNADGTVALRSGRGFAIYDDKYTSVEERELINLAINNVDNPGSAKVVATLRVIVAKEKATSIDTSGIKLVA